ncbi:MAG: hypothetical protein SPK90_03355, partial [Bacteroidales bacterium]|nr:hypothetical protein [Bacteroidales bacterium]
AIEVSRGKDRHGSCGMGIWETVLRYSKMKTYTLDEFCYLPKEFKVKYLKDIKLYFENRGVKLPKELVEPWPADDDVFVVMPAFLTGVHDTIIHVNAERELQIANSASMGGGDFGIRNIARNNAIQTVFYYGFQVS